MPPPDTNLKANDQRLFEALGEIHRACENNSTPFPALTSIVVRRNEDGTLGMPGPGYFALVFPQVTEQKAKQQIWRDEVRRVVASSYPGELKLVPLSQPAESKAVTPWLREPTVIAAIIGLAGTVLAVIIPVWLSTRHVEPLEPRPASPLVLKTVQQTDEPSQPRSSDRLVLKTIPQTDEPSHSDTARRTEEKKTSQKLTLGEILDELERHHQRSTFGAVAGVLGSEPRSLFNGYVRSPKTAWVVSKATGLPTGTKENDYPPGLLENNRIIDAPDELRVWLRENH